MSVSETSNLFSTKEIKKENLNDIYFDPSFLKLDLEKLRIFLNVLEEHEQNCEREERYQEAAITRDKIKLLKDVEEIKILSDLENLQTEQVSDIVNLINS